MTTEINSKIQIPIGEWFTANLQLDPLLVESPNRWIIRSNHDSTTSGVVEWYPIRKQFIFVPSNYTVFERGQIYAIADFLEHQTRMSVNNNKPKTTENL